MNYYIELKITSYALLSEIISMLHNSGKLFAFYFDNVNKVRIFSDSLELLRIFYKDVVIHETPKSVKHIKCTRVRALEKTPIQQTKRLERFKKHLAAKGIIYDENHARKPISTEFDYFIDMSSKSSHQNYCIYVKNTVVYKQKAGRFSSYGLSLNGATVPLF